MRESLTMPDLPGRLGLAREATALLRGEADRELPGIREDVRQELGVEVHTVTVLNEEGSRLISKPPGSYVTCTLPADDADDGPTALVLSQEIGRLLPEGGEGRSQVQIGALLWGNPIYL